MPIQKYGRLPNILNQRGFTREQLTGGGPEWGQTIRTPLGRSYLRNEVYNVGGGGGPAADQYANTLYNTLQSQVGADLARRGFLYSSSYLQSAVSNSAQAQLAAFRMRESTRQNTFNEWLQSQQLYLQQAQLGVEWSFRRGEADAADLWSYYSQRPAGVGRMGSIYQRALTTPGAPPISPRPSANDVQWNYWERVRRGELTAPGATGPAGRASGDYWRMGGNR